MRMNEGYLISYLLDELSPEEVMAVERWCRQDSRNEKKLEQMKVIWELSKRLDMGSKPDTLASFERFKEKVNTAKVIKMRTSHTWLKVAAAVAVLITGTWMFYLLTPVKQASLVATAVVKEGVLPDGSRVTLNKQSRIRYPEKYTGKERYVELQQGEVFFEVSQDKERPFTVKAGDTRIKVVGTSFNVKNINGIVEVIVETGAVIISRDKERVLAGPRQKVVSNENTASLLRTTTSDRLYNYYRTKEFIANDTPLSELVKVLNEAYDSHIVIERPGANDFLLNTTFKDASLEEIIAVISKTFQLQVEKKNDTIILK